MIDSSNACLFQPWTIFRMSELNRRNAEALFVNLSIVHIMQVCFMIPSLVPSLSDLCALP